MPSLGLDVIRSIHGDNILDTYPIFVETGTYLGETIFQMEKFFKILHTIEIKEEFHRIIKSRYTGDKITFHLGDSSNILNELVDDLTDNTIFFLDGHWSSGDTGRGEKDCPLMEEVEAIMKKFNHSAILIIDDYRLFGKGPSEKNEIVDWTNISKDKLLELTKNRMSEYYHLPSSLHLEDRLIIHLKSLH